MRESIMQLAFQRHQRQYYPWEGRGLLLRQLSTFRNGSTLFFQVKEVEEEVGKQAKEELVEVNQTEKEVAVCGKSKVIMTVASFES